jgi:hypothetical protein
MITAAFLIILIGVYLTMALVHGLRRTAGGLIADGGGMEELVAALEQDAVERIDAQQDSPSRNITEPPAHVPGSDGLAPGRGPVTTTEQAEAATAKPATEVQPDDMSRRLPISLLLVAGLLVGIILFGLEVAVPVIFVLFLRLVTRERWLTTIATAVISCATLYLVFHTMLEVPLEGGILQSH